MRLTHIKLSGFKSFVDPTTIAVPGQLVAVIGPNGCGKSNVIDAVRWVLGEASAKQLRGQSMQDVIFNGATTRKPVSRAIVELVFDNSDHQLQGSWGQYAEVSIKRVLTRQGESSYFINNQAVRRRDITDLFLGTGVGTRGYAVIEQGMISRIIEAKPEELRAYLEEAAGVSKYKERRKETEQRLQDTQDNLNRLHDLQTELERQISKLEQQAKIAAQYQTLTQTLHDKQNLLTFVRFQEANTQANELSLTIAQHQTTIAQLELTSNQLNEESYQLQLTEHEKQQDLHQTQNKWALVREQLARLEEKIRYQQNQHQRLTEEKQKTDRELEQLNQEELLIEQGITQLETQLEQQQWLLSECQLQLDNTQEQLPELETQLQELESAFLNQHNAQNRLERERDLSIQKKKQLEQQQIDIQQRLTTLAKENQELDAPNEQTITIAQDTLLLEQTKQETLTEKNDYLEITLEESLNHAQTLQQQLTELHNQKVAHQAQKEALERLSQKEKQSHDQFWQEQRLEHTPVLWENIEVEPNWQQALTIVLQERLYARNTLIDLQKNTPNSEIVWLNDTKLSDTRLPLSSDNALRHKVQAKAPFDIALDIWLQNIICINTVEEAIQKQKQLSTNQIFITPEGHLIDCYSVHWQGDETQTSNQLSLQEEIKQHSDALDALVPHISTLEQQKQQQQTHTQDIKNQLNELKNNIKIAHHTLQTAHNHYNQLMAKQAQTQLRSQHIAQEQEQLTQQYSQLTNQLTQETAFIEDREKALAALVDDHQHTQQQRNTAQNNLQNIRAQMYDASRRLGLEQIAEQKLLQQIAANKQQLEHIKQRYQSLTKRQNELNLEFNDTPEQAEPLAALENLIETQTQLEETLNQIQNELQTLQERNKHLALEQQKTLANQNKQQQTLQETLLAQQQAQLLAEHLQEELTKNQANISELIEMCRQIPEQSSLAQEISILANNIQKLGAVNLVALEELEQAKERQHYFTIQRDDLNQAITSLKDAIEQIDNESKALFQNTFDMVNEKIQQFFPTLFGGGQARLEMVGEDLLSSGVSIMAHPPGKKNSTIHLLSGGEKALTAMSLVFALFSLNPAPFCLLDEVDAPLDDANTSRFCQLVQEMSHQTQFLYISHNRLTMQMAEQLVGVTMQEKGVSRIVSVDIQEALNMREGAD
ncbi:chromosome segregation protein SMC [Neisseria sp. Ec49-e6-T10]|uniref:chromosome segregation protein SMC n=1 Tax=Neisseria sp. Ec49-e6-T10 TaxID=3140744 RepID=UPI003EBCCCD8